MACPACSCAFDFVLVFSDASAEGDSRKPDIIWPKEWLSVGIFSVLLLSKELEPEVLTEVLGESLSVMVMGSGQIQQV
jgi:hypothetical protein